MRQKHSPGTLQVTKQLEEVPQEKGQGGTRQRENHPCRTGQGGGRRREGGLRAKGAAGATGAWNTVTGRTNASRAGGSGLSVRRQQALLQSFSDKGFSSPLLGFKQSDGSGGGKPDEESPGRTPTAGLGTSLKDLS